MLDAILRLADPYDLGEKLIYFFCTREMGEKLIIIWIDYDQPLSEDIYAVIYFRQLLVDKPLVLFNFHVYNSLHR